MASKHKKEHKKHKSKHKKEKKYKKHKKEKPSKYTTSSSSSTSSDDAEFEEKKLQREQEENFLECAISKSNSSKKDKKVNISKERDVYNPKTNCRELNPYWKDNGTGLPLNVSITSF